jgi:hypothetical protein
MADEQAALAGHRKSVREHIAKSEYYKGPGEREFALKTVKNAQGHIAKLIKRHPHWLGSWEDKWLPGMPHPRISDWSPGQK